MRRRSHEYAPSLAVAANEGVLVGSALATHPPGGLLADHLVLFGGREVEEARTHHLLLRHAIGVAGGRVGVDDSLLEVRLATPPDCSTSSQYRLRSRVAPSSLVLLADIRMGAYDAKRRTILRRFSDATAERTQTQCPALCRVRKTVRKGLRASGSDC